MHSIALLLALSGAPPLPAPKLPSAQIQIEDFALHIPLLPRNRLDARWHIRQAHAEFDAATKLMDHYLGTLGTSLLNPGDDTTVSAAQATEAKRLLARLQDDQFAGHFAELLKELKAWAADSRLPQAKDKIQTEEERKGGGEVLRYVPISPETGPGRTPIDDLSPNGPFRNPDASSGGGAWDVHTAPLKDISQPFLREALATRDDVAAGESRMMAVARRHEVKLAQCWATVLGQLEADAKAVADLTARPPEPPSPALLELRRRVKLQLVQRYQASLKLCRFIWVNLAADPSAKPTK